MSETKNVSEPKPERDHIRETLSKADKATDNLDKIKPKKIVEVRVTEMYDLTYQLNQHPELVLFDPNRHDIEGMSCDERIGPPSGLATYGYTLVEE